jgi:hypothetical protein
MRSHYLCSSADKCEDAESALRRHGYIEATRETPATEGCSSSLIPTPTFQRVDDLVHKAEPSARRLGLLVVQTPSRVRRVAWPMLLTI